MAEGRVRAIGSVQALREQMDLPLWFDIRIAAEHVDAVRSALGHLPISAIEAKDGHVAVQCRREAKMAVLEALPASDRMPTCMYANRRLKIYSSAFPIRGPMTT
jgi:Cu-processing system ATP-binding protein